MTKAQRKSKAQISKGQLDGHCSDEAGYSEPILLRDGDGERAERQVKYDLLLHLPKIIARRNAQARSMQASGIQNRDRTASRLGFENWSFFGHWELNIGHLTTL